MEFVNYIEIENLRDKDVDLGIGIVRKRNDQAFRAGDTISITEKIDGSNAGVQYDAGTHSLIAFSRRHVLNPKNTLSGFYDFVQELDPREYSNTPNLAIFGEWLIKNKIIYEERHMAKWYIYSIYDQKQGRWLTQTEVKQFAEEHHLEYIHELYYGPFVSWEHCRGFLNSPLYGERQEGIVVRDITALEEGRKDGDHILKIVNKDFKETKNVKILDPEKDGGKLLARELMESIVTVRRVEKMLAKLREDNILPAEITPKDMRIVSKELPKLIYDDCVKEEKEIVERAGKYAKNMSASIAMGIARDILLGE